MPGFGWHFTYTPSSSFKGEAANERGGRRRFYFFPATGLGAASARAEGALRRLSM